MLVNHWQYGTQNVQQAQSTIAQIVHVKHNNTNTTSLGSYKNQKGTNCGSLLEQKQRKQLTR